MLKFIISRLVSKHGMIPLLLKVGDIAVGITKSKEDDKAWAQIKKVMKMLNG